MNIIFYSHGGSGNHGCEAIVRSTLKLLNKDFQDVLKTVYSYAVEEDRKYIGNRENLSFEPLRHGKRTLGYYWAALRYKIGDKQQMTLYHHRQLLKRAKRGDLAIALGGDCYTYDGWPELLSTLNNEFHKKKVKTVLWGCSLSSDLMLRNDVVNDMKRYDLITVRETLTQSLLLQAGVNQKKVILVSDPAFNLDDEPCLLPSVFENPKGVVGVNMSPLSLSCGSSSDIVLQNYKQLIDYILKKTGMSVVLLPHVVWKSNDDISAMDELYKGYENNERVGRLSDRNCEQLKYIISRCRFFVGARTHATIAAYSRLVPTLVIGYSLKAIGIAKDLFDKSDGFVLAVQDFKSPNDITNAFKEIVANELNIKDHLKQVIPEYIAKSKYAITALVNMASSK